jgi:hypothetical protein
MSKHIALGSLMIISALVPCNARALQAPDGSIRLNTISGIPVVDGVFLNGRGPYRFVLDTGGQTNQVEESLAQKIGLARTFQVKMATAAGVIPVAGGRVAEVSLGSASASNQEFVFTTLDGPHVLSAEIKGVLGQEFLAHFDYLLDFAKHRLVFGEPAPEGGSRVGFETIDSCPAIETSEGRLVLDSGANSTILFRSAPPAADGSTIRTASGTASVSTIQGLRLKIGGREYRPAKAAAIPRVLLKGDGLLSATLFRAIYISNSSKYVILDPSTDSRETGRP